MNGIYQILCLPSGKRYIGSAKKPRNRWHTHLWMLRHGKHHSIHLQRAFNKYAEGSFYFSIIENVVEFSCLREREQFWMNSYAGELYNQAPNAQTNIGVRKTSEQKERSASYHRGRIRSPITRSRMSAAMAGNTNGRFSARDTCGKGHLHSGENLYVYTVASGTSRRACKTCMIANNVAQNVRRARVADFIRGINTIFYDRYQISRKQKIHAFWLEGPPIPEPVAA